MEDVLDVYQRPYDPKRPVICVFGCDASIATPRSRRCAADFADVLRVMYIVPDAAGFPDCWPVLRQYLRAVRPVATMISAGLSDPRMPIEIQVTARKRIP